MNISLLARIGFVTVALLFAVTPLLAAASTCPNLTRNLSFGSRGQDVVELQNFLIEQGHLGAGNNTGNFRALTEAAVKKFQCAQNVVCFGTPKTTGYGAVGPRTRQVIAQVCSAQIIPLSCTTPWGTTIQSGSSVTAYQSGTVSVGQSCQSQTRLCTNGSLSGTYQYATCSVVTTSCTPLSPQTQTLACPAGQTGSIIQTRTSTCPGPTWSAWTTTSNTCSINSNTDQLTSAINDLFKNFWTGDKVSGHIIPTWDGIVGNPLPDERGATWPASTFLNVLYARYLINPTEANAQPIRAEWNYLKSVLTDTEAINCGASSPMNFGSDDTGWNAATYLKIYDVTRDARALGIAKGAVKCGFERWGDTELGGGLWYNDDKNAKSLYGIGLALSAFRLFELTSEPIYLSYAKFAYDWMEQKLLRNDSIYWTDYGWWTKDHSTAPAPLGVERPDDIRLGGSVSFLGGTMGMDILHARMYRLTGNELYKQRAVNIARGFLNKFVDSNGGFLNDRDAWANGTFVREWIIEVYPLLPADLQQKAKNMFQLTADAIVTKDRTTDGYYGPNWNTGPGTAVWRDHTGAIHTRPEQIMTTATAIDLVSGPQLIDARLSIPSTPPQPAYLPPFPLPPLVVTATLFGQTMEDLVGTNTEGADGVKDVRVRLTGIASPIKNVQIQATDGAWTWPNNGVHWIVLARPEADPTNVNLYFNFYKTYSTYTISVTLTDGRVATVQTISNVPQVSATLLGQTGEDFVGYAEHAGNGVKDVHILLTGVPAPITKIQIASADGAWEYPYNGVHWTALTKPQADPTKVDVYFDFWKQFSFYTLAITLSDGKFITIQAQ